MTVDNNIGGYLIDGQTQAMAGEGPWRTLTLEPGER
jgi:hypothetical protein